MYPIHADLNLWAIIHEKQTIINPTAAYITTMRVQGIHISRLVLAETRSRLTRQTPHVFRNQELMLEVAATGGKAREEEQQLRRFAEDAVQAVVSDTSIDPRNVRVHIQFSPVPKIVPTGPLSKNAAKRRAESELAVNALRPTSHGWLKGKDIHEVREQILADERLDSPGSAGREGTSNRHPTFEIRIEFNHAPPAEK